MIEAIGTYRVLEHLPGGANGQCFRVERDGQVYFAKQLLRPKPPTAPSLTYERRQRMQKICEVFVEHESALLDRLFAPTFGAGNIVLPVERLWTNSGYVKVFPFLEEARRSTEVPLDPDGAMMLMRSLCLGVASLHSRGIAHGDLKPENIIARSIVTSDGRTGSVAALIDLEDCFWAAAPPRADRLGGDLSFMSPDLKDYRSGAAAYFDALKSEVHVLAMVIHYLLGNEVPREGRVRRIVSDHVKEMLPRRAFDVLQTALRFDPADRPTAIECFDGFSTDLADSHAVDEVTTRMGRIGDDTVTIHMGRRREAPRRRGELSE